MNVSAIIVDDFYVNPVEVRNFALQQDFNVTGNFPGARTRSFWNDDVKRCIEYNMQFAGKITNTFTENDYSGAFQLTTAQDRTWIHSDWTNMWAGVVYLTPDAPHTGGTGLFRHKRTGNHYNVEKNDYESYDYTKWDLFDIIGNKFNRLILYRGDLFHASLDYFGHDKETGRLFQTFFFNTEKWA